MHQTIDWFSWLSKSGLEPSLIYEYGMAFSHNELEEDDIAYFNHEFLQSMGISIAKHRLEILKLARKHKVSSGSHPMSKLILAIKKTKRTVANYVRTWVHRDDSALVLVHRSYGSRWKGAMLKRNKRSLATFKQAKAPTLLLTNGYRSGSVKVNSFSSPLVYDHPEKTDGGDRVDHDNDDDEEDEDGSGGYWSRSVVEEIKWDTMFQNLKPT